jgi:MFS family permease
MALACLPAAPPAPPSPSAQLAAGASCEGGQGRLAASPLALLRALPALYRRPAFAALAAAYAATGGVFSAAGAFLPTNLAQLGASLSYAAWVGVAVNAGSLALGVGVGAVSDWLKRRWGAGSAKALLVGVTLASGGCFAAFAGVAAGFAAPPPPWALPLAAAAYTLGSSLLAAQVALSFDMAAEHAFGVGPEATCLVGLSLPMNTVTMVALFAPAASLFAWINWAQAAVCCAAGGLLWAAVPECAPKSEYDYAQLALAEGAEGSAETEQNMETKT